MLSTEKRDVWPGCGVGVMLRSSSRDRSLCESGAPAASAAAAVGGRRGGIGPAPGAWARNVVSWGRYE